MLLHFACHDPAHASPNGDYWVWRSSRIPDKRLREYYRHLAGCMPDPLVAFSPHDLHGGCLALDGNECCFYRYYDGGRDTLGRPGRRVLLIAVAERDAALTGDASELLEQAGFESFEQDLRSGAVAVAPSSLDQVWPMPESPLTPAPSVPTQKIFNGELALAESWNVVRRGSASQPFHWKVYRRNKSARVEIDWNVGQTANQRASKISPETSIVKTNTKAGEAKPVKPDRPTRSRRRMLPRRGFALVLCGIVLGGLLRHFLPLESPIENTPPLVDRAALRLWLENYRDPMTGPLIPAQVLLERLDRNDWTSHPTPSGLTRTQAVAEFAPLSNPMHKAQDNRRSPQHHEFRP